MYCLYSYLKKKMPLFLSSIRQQSRKEKAAWRYFYSSVSRRKRLLGPAVASCFFNIKCNKFCIRLKSHLASAQKRPGACQALQCPDFVDRFCLLIEIQQWRKKVPPPCRLFLSLSKQDCGSKAMQTMESTANFNTQFLPDANNQTHTTRWTHPSG